MDDTSRRSTLRTLILTMALTTATMPQSTKAQTLYSMPVEPATPWEKAIYSAIPVNGNPQENGSNIPAKWIEYAILAFVKPSPYERNLLVSYQVYAATPDTRNILVIPRENCTSYDTPDSAPKPELCRAFSILVKKDRTMTRSPGGWTCYYQPDPASAIYDNKDGEYFKFYSRLDAVKIKTIYEGKEDSTCNAVLGR